MIRWIRKLSRLNNIGLFMEKLKCTGVINDTQKRYFEMDCHRSTSMEKLILFVQNETKENVVQFVTSLREFHPIVADLLMGTDEDDDAAGILHFNQVGYHINGVTVVK